MSKINFEGGGHWYDKDGSPRHDASLREARLENLFPSVTSILGVLAKPALETWKLNQVLLASLTLPRISGESEEDYASRVVYDFKSQSSQAADLGTKLHNWAENYILLGEDKREEIELYGETLESLKLFIDKEIDKTTCELEKPIIPTLMYGGRVDIQGPGYIMDWKSQAVKMTKTKKPKPAPVFYPEWCAQLVAYAKGDLSIKLTSVIMSTSLNCPGVWSYEWTMKEKKEAWDTFRAAHIIFRNQKGHYPKWS